jgi:hypothetical protein
MSNFRGIMVEYIDVEKGKLIRMARSVQLERAMDREAIRENGNGKKVEGKKIAANMRSDTRNAGTNLNNFCYKSTS